MPVWRAAFQELVQARRWVLVGTSLPETDRFLRYLFGLALKRNKNLDKITIANIESTSYQRLFADLPKRQSLEAVTTSFVPSLTVGTFQHTFVGQVFGQFEQMW
jgi:hypothetical protein